MDAAGHDVYVGLGLRESDLGRGSRGGNDDVIALPGFWADLDCADPNGAHKATNLPTSLDDVVELIVEAYGEERMPSMLVSSGHGYHAYWLVDEPWRLSTRGQRIEAKQHVKAWQEKLVAAAARRSWHLDLVADVARVLRIPGLHNRKITEAVVPTEVIYCDERAFSRAELGLGAPVVSSSSTSKPLNSDLAARAPTSGKKRTAIQLPPGGICEFVTTRLQAITKHPEAKQIANGESFAPRGKRDDMLQRMTSLVAQIALEADPGVEGEELVAIFEPSLSVWAEEPEADKTVDEELLKALDKLERNLLDLRPKVEEKLQREEAELVWLRRKARATGTAAFLKLQDGKTDAELGEPYTDDELALFAKTLSCTVDELEQRWIIQVDTSFFVFVAGRYRKPVTQTALLTKLRDDLAPAPVFLEALTQKGTIRQKKREEILHDYATAARTLAASLSLQDSYYDPVTETFCEATSPIRDTLSPAYHEQIDTWLQLLGGEHVEKFLDWLATLTQLTHQTAAIYLSGPKGAGKGLLATGAARIWTEGGPALLDAIVGDFNSDIARCPLVFADERVPKGSTPFLRDLIGSNSRTLKRKHVTNASLQGAVRLILAANNERLLSVGEDLSLDDEAAIADRFLHIRVNSDPVEYLELIGGRAATNDWVDGDLIAKHLLWLRDNRQVTPGKRWLVEGEQTEVHRFLGVQGTRELVMEWLAGYLESPTILDKTRGMVKCGNGEFLVTTEAVTTRWEDFVQSSRQPSKKLVGSALKHLSTGERAEIAGRRAHKIRHEFVVEWANEHDVADPIVMLATVQRPAGGAVASGAA